MLLHEMLQNEGKVENLLKSDELFFLFHSCNYFSKILVMRRTIIQASFFFFFVFLHEFLIACKYSSSA